MSESAREVLSLEPMADDAEVGRWLSAMEDCRLDTLKILEGVPEDALDLRRPGVDNTIGSLLYHIALVEADWMHADILGPESGVSWPEELLPAEDRGARDS